MSNIIRPLAGGVFGALKAEESKIKLLAAMDREGAQIPQTMAQAAHVGVERALLEAVCPGGGQVKLELMLAVTSVGFANVVADYLGRVETGPLSAIPQTDGFMEAVVDAFRIQLNNAVVARRVDKMRSRAVGLPQ